MGIFEVEEGRVWFDLVVLRVFFIVEVDGEFAAVLSIRFVIVGIFDLREDWACWVVILLEIELAVWIKRVDFLVSPIVEVETDVKFEILVFKLAVLGTFGVVIINPFRVVWSVRLVTVGIFEEFVIEVKEDWVWVKILDVVVVVWFVGIGFEVKLVFKFTVVGALRVVVNPFWVLDFGAIVEVALEMVIFCEITETLSVVLSIRLVIVGDFEVEEALVWFDLVVLSTADVVTEEKFETSVRIFFRVVVDGEFAAVVDPFSWVEDIKAIVSVVGINFEVELVTNGEFETPKLVRGVVVDAKSENSNLAVFSSIFGVLNFVVVGAFELAVLLSIRLVTVGVFDVDEGDLFKIELVESNWLDVSFEVE